MKLIFYWLPTICFILGAILPVGGMVAYDWFILDACAESKNVYKCKFIAVPVKEAQVIYKLPELIPPPVVTSK